MPRLAKALPALALLFGLALPAAAPAQEAVTIDGDSLSLAGKSWRLAGIDAPELEQSCERDGRRYPCGKIARAALFELIGAATVTCAPLDPAPAMEDLIGGEVPGRCQVEGRSLALSMLHKGWAIPLEGAEVAFFDAASVAHQEKRGLWAGSFTSPSAWRREQPGHAD